jgi:hypothetical protein
VYLHWVHHADTKEAARAIRKKLKYGNVHRQIRALVILRALTENGSKGFRVNWANEQLVSRLKEMASDVGCLHTPSIGLTLQSLLDPKVKKRLILVFHAWSIQYAVSRSPGEVCALTVQDEPRMQQVANLYRQYGGGGPSVRRVSRLA